MNRKTYLFLILYIFTTSLFSTIGFADSPSNVLVRVELPEDFRQDILHFVRHYIETGTFKKTYPWMHQLTRYGPWSCTITFYRNGSVLSSGQGSERKTSDALEKAIQDTFKNNDFRSDIDDTIICYIALSSRDTLPIHIIEYQGQALELSGNVIPVRFLDKNRIYSQIQSGKEYLLRTIHPEIHGFYKKYDVINNDFGKKIRTIYSASCLYTLLKIHALDHDPQIAQDIPKIAQFLLSMQVPEGNNQGAYYYSLDAKSLKKEQRFVTGTASKTIFTMLSMYQYSQDPLFLQSAIQAGKWLLTMQNTDGSIISEVYYKNGRWVVIHKFSFLYSGQVLSALSRLYHTTSDPIYYNGAKKTAIYIMNKARQQGYFVGDNYRSPNPVSTSWLIMSLLDYHKISHDEKARRIIIKTATELIKKQCLNRYNILNYGRFIGSSTTSGNGWINEVFGEYYNFCTQYNKNACPIYKNAILLLTRWLIQNTYSEPNTFFLRNGEKAIGGLIRHPRENSV
ncbi:MAG: terpene cyclase/mutase family protein, partial [Chlamydiota bacterium]|nr:terpene cyclase/mutase family protein [Chlamydiota bacterium]